ncbi:MAG: hypothetical protein AAFY71_13270 [Bacteroidota bacterium]
MKRYLQIAFVLMLASSPLLTWAQEEISPERKEAIDSLALEKVRDLSRYISIIGNKSTPFSEGNRVIERAVELFADGSEIGVSSLYKKNIQYFEVRRYFERLMALNYDRVEIKWYNIQYISDLVQQPDGRFVGVVTIFQRFEGITGEGLKYMDTTKKDITIYVQKKTIQIGGKDIAYWDVLLGDIRVKETKP